jgi:outer membrane receptor protein involved in Fe transport
MRFVRGIHPAVVATALLAGSSVRAEDPPTYALDSSMDIDALANMSLEDLLNIEIVTASGGAEASAMAPANVVTVTRQEIERHGWRSLAEILAGVPGLYVVDDHVLPAVSVRGISGGLRAGTRLVKVMINGFAVNFRPDLTAFLGPEFIPLEAIDRVEIAKGPLSALYGANAFLATVNVVTRRSGVGTSSTTNGRVESVEVASGHAPGKGYGFSQMATYAAKGHEVLLSFSMDRADRSGLAVEKTFDEQNPQLERYALIFGDSSRGDVAETMTGYGSLRLDGGSWGKVILQAGMQQFDRRGEFGLNSVLTHRTRHALENYFADVIYENTWMEGLSTQLRLGWSEGRPTRDTHLYITGNQASFFRPRFGYEALNAALEAQYELGKALAVKVGVDVERNDERILFYREVRNTRLGELGPGDGTDIDAGPDVQRHEILRDIGVYAQASGTPLPGNENLRLTGNLRYDDIQYGDDDAYGELSWRAAAAYRWNEEVVTKLIAGRAFQAPSGVLLFGRSGFGTSGNVIGNHTLGEAAEPLRAQEVTSVEAVVSAQLFSIVGAEIGIYAQQIKHKIEFVQSGIEFTATNAEGESRALGGEGTIRATLGRFWPFFVASVHSEENEEGALTLDPVPSHPAVRATLGLDVDLADYYLQANVQLRWVGERGATQGNAFLNNDTPYTLPSYSELDFSLSTVGWHPLGETTETRLHFGVENVLDKRHSEPGYGGLDLPGLGRTVRFQLQQTF